MTVDLRRDGWLIASIVVSILVVSLQFWRLTILQSTARRDTAAKNVAPAGARFSPATDQRLLAAAAQAGVNRLASIEIRGNAREQLRGEWQSASSATTTFLAVAESAGVHIDHLRGQAAPGGTRWTLTATPGASHPMRAVTPPIPHDPFFIPISSFTTARAPARRSHHAERAKQAMEIREKTEARVAAEAQRLDQRCRDILAAVHLSATTNNGREPVALAEVTESGQRRSVTLHRGDIILGGRVDSIDDRAGALSIDVEGKVQVMLRMPGAPP